jgi:hypothetical protein
MGCEIKSSVSHPGCDIMLGMRFLPKLGRCDGSSHDSKGPEASGEIKGGSGSAEASGEEFLVEDSNLLKTVGWISAALGAVALGLLVGREIRQRYKFNRRTPYDLYSHSGDELPDVDCGVGI